MTQTDPNNFLYLHATTFDNPRIPDFERKIMELHSGSQLYKQEYLAEFIDSGGEVFTNIDELFTLPAYSSWKKTAGGIDIARNTDFNVQYVLNEKKELVYHSSFSGKDFNTIDQSIENSIKKFGTEFLIDATGVGAPVCERLEKNNDGSQRYAKYIERMVFNSTNKSHMINKLRYSIQNNEIKLLNIDFENMKKIKNELECYEFRLNEDSTGAIKYGAPKGMNDDEVVALGLSNEKHNTVFNKKSFNFAST